MKKITEITTEREFVSKLRTYYRKARRKGYLRNEISFLGLMEYTGCATREFEYQSDKYFSVGIRAYDWVHGNSLLSELIDKWENEIEAEKRKKQPAQPTETPRISTQTAETVNVSAEGENAAERKEIKVQTIADMVAIGESLNKGESVSFKLHLHFLWSVTITNESAEWCEGFKYSLDAKCLDNPQSFGRRYTSFGLAMLHCLNRFNENANIRDDYETLSAVLNKPQNLISDFRAPQSPEAPQTVECVTDTPKPRETARKRQNRAIGGTRATRRDTLRNTLHPVTYVPRECSTTEAVYW